MLTPKLDHHKGENPSDLRGKTQRPVNQFFAPRNSKRKKVDSSDEDDPDNDVADSVTGNNVVVDQRGRMLGTAVPAVRGSYE